MNKNFLFLIGYSLQFVFSSNVTAQLIPDDTLGIENSVVTPQAIRDLIEGGAIRGENLFHSFLEFNVNNGQEVFFSNPQTITNIFTRITGTNPSNIDGRLGVNGNANLFLLNPNGIIFGTNAFLDLRGSFFATTAESFVFDNGLDFSATNPQSAPLLTINITPGLQYGTNATGIEVEEANLAVERGQTLALQGGSNVSINNARLRAPQGQVEINATDQINIIASEIISNSRDNENNAGIVAISSTEGSINLEQVRINTNNFEGGIAGDIFIDALGEVSISNRSFFASNGQEGQIVIGQNFTPTRININDSELRTNNINQSLLVGRAGDIEIIATEEVVIDNNSLILSDTTNPRGTGNGVPGSITISAPNLIEVINSRITSNSDNSNQDFGSISLQANQGSINLEQSRINTSNFGSGFAGNIVIDAQDQVSISNNSLLESSGQEGNIVIGQGVTPTKINIDNSRLRTINDNQGFEPGKAGNIEISATETVSIINDSRIFSDTFDAMEIGDGVAGSITVSAPNLIEIINSRVTSDSDNSSEEFGSIYLQANQGSIHLEQVTINTSNFGSGIAGDIFIDAQGEVSISNNSLLESSGQEGQIIIGQDVIPTRIILNNSNIITDDLNQGIDAGRAGNIEISATETVSIINDSHIFSDTFDARETGDGVAGSIAISAPKLVEIFNSQITSESNNFSQDFGLIDLLADEGTINIEQSRISTNNFGGGIAGDIFINAQDQVLISNASDIVSNGDTGLIIIGGELPPRNISINSSQLTTTNNIDVPFSNVPLDVALDAGNLGITTLESITLNNSELSALTARTGNAGIVSLVTVNSDSEIVLNNSNINSRVTLQAIGDAGNINISTNSLIVNNFSEISTETLGDGDAGSINLEATSVTVTEHSIISSEANSNSDGGTVTINTEQLLFTTDSQATVSSMTGLAGNLIVDTDNLTLDTGSLLAFTAGGGANIELNVANLLFIDNESLISATAQEQANGGNVTIDARFIVATPPTGEIGSDISANAFAGNGGLVSIDTQGLFGITFQPINTQFNDITASSELGDAGIVEILQPNTNPAQSITNLSTNLIDATSLIVRSCPTEEESKLSRFVVTGRGGLASLPEDFINSEDLTSEWINVDNSELKMGNSETIIQAQTSPIVEAQGWYVNERGNVVLTAHNYRENTQIAKLNADYCNE